MVSINQTQTRKHFFQQKIFWPVVVEGLHIRVKTFRVASKTNAIILTGVLGQSLCIVCESQKFNFKILSSMQFKEKRKLLLVKCNSLVILQIFISIIAIRDHLLQNKNGPNGMSKSSTSSSLADDECDVNEANNKGK